MDIQFFGANCLVLSNKQVRVVIDDDLAAHGGKPVTKDGDISLFTGSHEAPSAAPKLVIDMPGEYEVSNVSITGIQVRSHTDENGQKNATMYKIIYGDLRILVIGHAFPKLSDTDLETINLVDIMFVPVGGNGYTIDATGAMQLIRQVEPKLVVPTHYEDRDLSFEIPPAGLTDVLANMSLEPKETLKKLTVKPDMLTDTTQLIILEKS